jgi:hypothetical protein
MSNSEDAMELVLKDAVKMQNEWYTLKENIYCILQAGKENKEEKQTMRYSYL